MRGEGVFYFLSPRIADFNWKLPASVLRLVSSDPIRARALRYVGGLKRKLFGGDTGGGPSGRVIALVAEAEL